MVNANALRYIKNKPWTPSWSISPANKSLWTKAMDALEESWLLPRWLERRNQWATKAHVAWVAKWAYDLWAQWLRDMWALGTYWVAKIWWDDDATAWAKVNQYYQDTNFVDKPDEALIRYAYDNATPEVAAANLSRWEREWMWMATVGALRSPVKSTASTERATAQARLNQLMKNPSAYSTEEAMNIIRARHSLPLSNTEKALQSLWKWIDNVAQKIWNTKLFKAYDKAQARKAARELWITDFNTSKVKPWTDILRWEDYPAFAQKRYNDWMQSVNWRPARNEPEWLYYMWTRESAPDKWLKLTQENTRNNNILKQAWYSDEEIFSLTPSERSKIVNDIEAEYIETWPHADAVERWLYEFQDAEKAAANTSRARANKLKSKNRSKAERTLLKKTARDAKRDVENQTLNEMYDEWKLNRLNNFNS